MIVVFSSYFSFDHWFVCPSSIYGFWLPPFGICKLFLFENLFLFYGHFINSQI